MNLKEFNDACLHEMDTLIDTAIFAAMAIRKYRKQKAEILADSDFSDNGKATRVAAARDAAKADLASTFQLAYGALSQIKYIASKALADKNAGSVDKQLLAEMQLSRAWKRYERLLDAGREPAEVVETAKDDPDGLRALRAELPAYLDAQYANGSDAAQIVDNTLAVLDRVEAPYLDSVSQRAREIQREIADKEHIIALAESAVYEELENIRGGVIPKWTGGVIAL